MADSSDIVARKDQHLDLALAQQTRRDPSPFDRIRLEPCALPEIALGEVDLSVRFLGRGLRAPLIISSMTGGPARGEQVNRHLAEAAGELGIALAVGSQRVALEGAGDGGLSPALRRAAPNALLLANLGGAQVAHGYGLDAAQRAVEMIGADGLIIHLNALQEAIQPGGDRDWRGVLAGIERLARNLGAPIVVKEVGFGISGAVARRLEACGVAAIDVAGVGGTDWAAIEGARSGSVQGAALADAFRGWGLPTPAAIRSVRAACPTLPLIGSGGIRNGVDAAKAIALGADMVGQAGGVLDAALHSAEAVVEHFSRVIQQLRIASFCTGARDLAALGHVAVVDA